MAESDGTFIYAQQAAVGDHSGRRFGVRDGPPRDLMWRLLAHRDHPNRARECLQTGPYGGLPGLPSLTQSRHPTLGLGGKIAYALAESIRTHAGNEATGVYQAGRRCRGDVAALPAGAAN